MDLAYDSSLPLRDLASCLYAGSQSGPGVSTGDEPAGTAQGEASPLLLLGHPLHGKGAAAGGGRGHDGGRWWRGDPVPWIWCSSLCLVGLPRSRGWDACVGLTAVLVVFFSVSWGPSTFQGCDTLVGLTAVFAQSAGREMPK